MNLQRPTIEYYSLRTQNYKRFQALDVIYTLFDELARIPYKSDEAMVSRQTLQLWQQDVHAAYHGAPQLPAVKALQNTFVNYELPEAYWQDIFTTIEMDIDRVLYFNNQDLNRYAEKKLGSLLKLYACVLDTHEPATKLLQQVACFIERVRILQQLGESQRFLHYIPEQTRTHTSCELWQLQQAQAESLACLQSFIADTRAAMPVDLDKLPKTLSSIRVMTMIYSELLSLLAKDPMAVLKQHIDLTPLAKLFYSYYYRFRC